MRYSPADIQAGEEGRAECAPGTRAEISLQTLGKTMVRHTVLLQPMDINNRADICVRSVEDPALEQVVVQGRQ